MASNRHERSNKTKRRYSRPLLLSFDLQISINVWRRRKRKSDSLWNLPGIAQNVQWWR